MTWLNQKQEIIAINQVDLTIDNEEIDDDDAIQGIQFNDSTESKDREGEEWLDEDTDNLAVESNNIETLN